MVECQIRCCKVLDPKVLDTIESMPREEFAPADVRSIAYMEGHLPLPCGQEMLSPLQEATLMQAIELTGEERVLEIGAGTGFLTAMLAMHAREVVSLELHAELAELAARNLANHGVTNARVVQANAMQGDALGDAAFKEPFDVIVIGAAVREIPAHLTARLARTGRIAAFVGKNPVVSLELHERIGNIARRTAIMETLLQEIEGVPASREFVF